MVSDFFRPKQVAGVHTVYVLTPLGVEKAENFTASTPYCEVLSQLRQSSASINEIAKETGVNPKKTKAIIKDMLQSGYVRRAPVQGD